jgi:MFS family permease
MAGSLSYQSANILLLLLAGLMFQLVDRQREAGKTILTLVLLTVVLALLIGTNETGMMVTFAVVTFMFLASLRQGWRASWPWLLLFLVAVACSAIVYFSPGNAVREATFALRHNLMRSLMGSLGMGVWTLLAWLRSPVFLVATALTPFLTALLCRSPSRPFQPRKKHLAGLIIGTLLLPFLLEFPAWWAMGGWPPPRTVDAIYFVFLGGWLFTVGAITVYFLPDGWREKGTGFRPVTVAAFLFTVVLFIPAVFTNSRFQHAQMDLQQSAPAFGAYMQQRYDLIGQALKNGQKRLLVPDFDGEYPRSVYFNDILPLSYDWRNVCYAKYFGLEKIKRQRGPRKPRPARVFPPSPAQQENAPFSWQ